MYSVPLVTLNSAHKKKCGYHANLKIINSRHAEISRYKYKDDANCTNTRLGFRLEKDCLMCNSVNALIKFQGSKQNF